MATCVNAVLAYLMQNPGAHGPTKIGLSLGIPYVQASSAVSPCLKVLVKKGAAKIVTVKGRNAYEWTGVKPEGVYMG